MEFFLSFNQTLSIFQLFVNNYFFFLKMANMLGKKGKDKWKTLHVLKFFRNYNKTQKIFKLYRTILKKEKSHKST